MSESMTNDDLWTIKPRRCKKCLKRINDCICDDTDDNSGQGDE